MDIKSIDDRGQTFQIVNLAINSFVSSIAARQFSKLSINAISPNLYAKLYISDLLSEIEHTYSESLSALYSKRLLSKCSGQLKTA